MVLANHYRRRSATPRLTLRRHAQFVGLSYLVTLAPDGHLMQPEGLYHLSRSSFLGRYSLSPTPSIPFSFHNHNEEGEHGGSKLQEAIGAKARGEQQSRPAQLCE